MQPISNLADCWIESSVFHMASDVTLASLAIWANKSDYVATHHIFWLTAFKYIKVLWGKPYWQDKKIKLGWWYIIKGINSYSLLSDAKWSYWPCAILLLYRAALWNSIGVKATRCMLEEGPITVKTSCIRAIFPVCSQLHWS